MMGHHDGAGGEVRGGGPSFSPNLRKGRLNRANTVE